MTQRPDRRGLPERLAARLPIPGGDVASWRAFLQAQLAALDGRLDTNEATDISQSGTIASQGALISAIAAAYAADVAAKWNPTYLAVLALLQRGYFTNGGVTGVVGTARTLTGWAASINVGGFVVSGPGDTVTIPTAGTYEIGTEISMSLSTGTASGFVTLLQTDVGTGTWNAIGRAWLPQITTAQLATGSITCLYTTVANEAVRVQVQRIVGTGTGQTNSTGTRLRIRRIT